MHSPSGPITSDTLDRSSGSLTPSINPAPGSTADILNAAKLTHGTGVSLSEMACHALATGIGRNGVPLYVHEAVTLWLAQKKPNSSPVAFSQNVEIAGWINLGLGNQPITAVTLEKFEGFLRGGRTLEGKPWARGTKKVILQRFKAVLQSVGLPSAILGLSLPGERPPPITFLTPERVRTVFENCPARARGFLAVVIFAAVRPHNAARLQPHHVDVVGEKIEFSSDKVKDRKSHVLEKWHTAPGGDILPGLPAVLWQWLARYPFRPQHWPSFQTLLRTRCGNWPRNVLRHTGATYHAAAHGIAATRLLLTHADGGMSKQFYIGDASAGEAARFFAITPDSCNFADHRGANRLTWPPDDELAQLVWIHSLPDLARALNTDAVTVGRHISVRSIQCPSRGFWNT